MSQVAKFNIKTKKRIKGFVRRPKPRGGVSSTREPINNGFEVTLEPKEGKNKMIIEIERNGQKGNLKEEFYIDICSPKGLDYTLTKTNDKCEIELKSLPTDWAALGTNVTVGTGTSG